MRALLLFLSFLLLPGCIGPASQRSPHPSIPTVESIARATLNSTLKIDITKASGDGHGSAWVIAPGVAVSARHVTHGAIHLKLTTRGGDWCPIKSWREHPDMDIALIEFDSCDIRPLLLRTAPVTEGTKAFAAGHPFWSEWSFTAGIVSDADVNGRIQLDTVAEPGMSGGPVVDEYGRVLGMAVSILAEPLMHTWGGETFAIPIDDIVRYWAQEGL